MNFRQYISKMTPKGWAMVGGSAAAAIVFLVVVMNFASQQSYSTLETGLDPAQTGKITSVLDAKGIGYQIQNSGTALAAADAAAETIAKITPLTNSDTPTRPSRLTSTSPSSPRPPRTCTRPRPTRIRGATTSRGW